MKYKILIAICIIMTLSGAVGSCFVLNSPEKQRVNIISDGKIVRTLDLTEQKDMTFDVKYNGRVNTVEVKSGRIHVKSAECPDHTCVKSGWLSSAAMPIVCLPNKLVIEFAGSESEVDAVAR